MLPFHFTAGEWRDLLWACSHIRVRPGQPVLRPFPAARLEGRNPRLSRRVAALPAEPMEQLANELEDRQRPGRRPRPET